ncbi:MAG: hypothetical protein E7163_00355 [Firmicutes bacterium]|nr:hypothetical protein [Bacillota bacterium]
MNKKDIVIGALVSVAILLITLLILIFTDVIKVGEPKKITEYKECEENKNDSISYTYEEIEGLYGTSSEDLNYNIYFHNNGTFIYVTDNDIVTNSFFWKLYYKR